MRRTAAAAALLVAAASASDFENWNPNERDPDGKTDAQLLVERAEFVREQIDDGGHLDADHDHKRGHVDIVAPDEPALRAAIERANAMPESKSVCIKLTASTVYVLTAPLPVINRSLTIEGPGPGSARSILDGASKFPLLQLHNRTGERTGPGVFEDARRIAAGGEDFSNQDDDDDDDGEEMEAGGVHQLTLIHLVLQHGKMLRGPGALGVYHGLLAVDGCAFQHNNGRHGAIQLEHAIAEVNRSEFDNNSALHQGGALYAANSKLVVWHSSLTRGKASHGGALASRHGVFKLHHVRMERNEAGVGGAIYKDTNHHHNKLSVLHADAHGAHAESQLAVVDGCVFSANRATSRTEGQDMSLAVRHRSEMLVRGGQFLSPFPIEKLARGHFDIDCEAPPIVVRSLEVICNHLECRENAALKDACLKAVRAATLPETDLSWHWEAYLRDAMILTGCAFIVVLAVVVMWPLLSQHRKRVANEAGEYEYEGVAQAPSKKQ